MGRPHFPDAASLGLNQCQVSRPAFCVEGQQVWFPLGWGVGPPLGWQPGSALPPAPGPGFQHLLLPHRDSAPTMLGASSVTPEDGPPAGGWTMAEQLLGPMWGPLILRWPRQVPALPPLFRWGH